MHLSKHWDDQACMTGDRCQWLFVSHAEVAHVQMVVVSGNTDGQPLQSYLYFWHPMASCFLIQGHCSH